MPWFWQKLFVFDERFDQYIEMDDITYEDALETPYDNTIWTELPIETEGP